MLRAHSIINFKQNVMNINVFTLLIGMLLPVMDNIGDIKSKIESGAIKPDIVTATMYQPLKGQTDKTPLITASGFRINPKHPEKHRIIAISWDLKRKYRFGSRVIIRGAGKHDGIYVVRDLMHKRWRNKIDILISPKQKAITIKNVKLYKV